jgi:hypothetical protein
MNVEIGAEAMKFPEKEYISGSAVAVQPATNRGDSWLYELFSARRQRIYDTIQNGKLSLIFKKRHLVLRQMRPVQTD